MSLGRQAAQGAVWNYMAFLASKGLLFVATLILARILSPEEFGLVGMALLVITILDILRDFGIGAAVIYLREDEDAAANLAFMLSVAIGVILFAGNWLLAPLAVEFFRVSSAAQEATVTSLLQVLGLSLLFASLGSVQDALLQKEIAYNRRMVPEVGRALVKGALQVALALAGLGVWSLVIGQVIGEAAATLSLWVLSHWRPTFHTKRSLVRPMVSYGSQIMLVGGLGTLLSDVDYFIIGGLLGEMALGLYTLAFRIPELLIKNLAQAVSTVAFPVAAKLQANREALREAYLTMQRYMLVILAPLGFGLFALTPPIMHILFQSKWDPAIPVMEVLSIYMVLGGINHWPGVVYKAVGRPDILNWLGVLKLAMLVPVLWWAAANYGILGVAWGQLVVRVASIFIDMWTIARFVRVGVMANLRVLWQPLAASTVMAALVRVVMLLDASQSGIAVTALAALVGAAVYAGAMWVLDRQTVLALAEVGRGLLSRKRAVAAGS